VHRVLYRGHGSRAVFGGDGDLDLSIFEEIERIASAPSENIRTPAGRLYLLDRTDKPGHVEPIEGPKERDVTDEAFTRIGQVRNPHPGGITPICLRNVTMSQ
jgi:hypothetical protein